MDVGGREGARVRMGKMKERLDEEDGKRKEGKTREEDGTGRRVEKYFDE